LLPIHSAIGYWSFGGELQASRRGESPWQFGQRKRQFRQEEADPVERALNKPALVPLRTNQLRVWIRR
jgi:hypothetical protein